jgi:starch phosphorylase
VAEQHARGEMTRAVTPKIPEPPLGDTSPEALAAEILSALKYRLGKDATVATDYDWLTASIKAVRDRIIDQWIESTARPTRRAPSGSITCRWSS